jgi:glycosyltransferase involved in cell wall biosynthesis
MNVGNKIKNFSKIPKFSIIIPTYNRGNLLPQAIRSILSQTFQDFELIIVNDGSIDNTEKIINSFNDKRIIYLKHKRNKGVLLAQDTGINKAKGEFVIWLGDDDELLTGALEFIADKISALSLKEAKILWFDSINVDTKERLRSIQRKEGFIPYKDLLCGITRVSDPIVVINRIIRSKIKPDERSWGNFGILWMDLYQKNNKYIPFYVPKIICQSHLRRGKHLSHPEASLKRISKVIFAQKTFLEQYGKEIKFLCPKYYRQKLALLGLYQVLNGEKIKGRKNIRNSFEFNFSLKYYFLFLISYILNKNQIKFSYLKFLKIKRIINRLNIF